MDFLAKKRRNRDSVKVGTDVVGNKRPWKIFIAMSFSEAKHEYHSI